MNVSGFGNTGCTAQSDFLAEYEGVMGVLEDPDRNLKVLKAPYQEFGILKTELSLGGLFVLKYKGMGNLPTKSVLRTSLKGDLGSLGTDLSRTERIHVEKRALLKKQYGEKFDTIIDEALRCIPERLDNLTIEDLLDLITQAMGVFIDGINNLILSQDIVDPTTANPIVCIGLKNDPPGAYPVLAATIDNGITSAILRDPRDTNFDFNNNANSFGIDMKAVVQHCQFYNKQLNSSREIINKYLSRIEDCFFVHDFENFVHSENHREKYLLRMIGGALKVRSYFDPSQSAENVGIYRKMPKQYLKVVEDRCMKPYDEYRRFLQERGLLLE